MNGREVAVRKSTAAAVGRRVMECEVDDLDAEFKCVVLNDRQYYTATSLLEALLDGGR